MSEWGIEQNSTFGNCGGCFVQGISLVGGIGIIILLCLTCSGTTKEQSAIQHKKVAKVRVSHNNTKYNDSTLFVKSLVLNQTNQKIKR